MVALTDQNERHSLLVSEILCDMLKINLRLGAIVMTIGLTYPRMEPASPSEQRPNKGIVWWDSTVAASVFSLVGIVHSMNALWVQLCSGKIEPSPSATIPESCSAAVAQTPASCSRTPGGCRVGFAFFSTKLAMGGTNMRKCLGKAPSSALCRDRQSYREG